MTGGLGRRGVRRSLAAALAVVLLGSLLAVVPVGLPLADGPSEAGAQQVASQAVLNRVTIVEGQTREFAISNVVSRPAYFVHVSVAGSFTAEAGDVRVTTDNRRGQAQVITPDADAPRAYRHSTYGTVAFEVTANADSDGAGDETFGVRLCTTADCAGGTVLGEWTVTVTEPAADTTLSGTGATLTIRGGGAVSVMEDSRNRDSRDRRATFSIDVATAPASDIVVVAYTETGVATGSSSTGPFARINSSLSRDYWPRGNQNHDAVRAEYVVGYWKSGTTGAREFTVTSTDNAVDTPGGTIAGSLKFKVLVDDAAFGGSSYGDAAVYDPPGTGSDISIPDLPVRVTGDDEPTRVRVLAAAAEDDQAMENNTSDTAKFLVKLERPLAAGESITAPLRFIGATLGRNFTVALDAASSDTGVSYADTPDTVQRNSQGAVTFTGANAQEATLEVTAITDSDTVSHRLEALVPEKSDRSKPYYFVTHDADGAETLAGGACAARACDSTQPTNRSYFMDLNEAAAGITIVDNEAGWMSEGTGGYTYGIRLSAVPASGSVTVRTTVSPSSVANTINTSDRVFTTANWQEPQNVTIRPVVNGVDAPNSVITVTHDVISAADSNYSGLDDVTYDLTVVDDDASTVTMAGDGVRTTGSSTAISNVMVEGNAALVDRSLTITLSRALAEGEYVRVPLKLQATANGHIPDTTDETDDPAELEPPSGAGAWPGDLHDRRVVTSVRGPRASANVAWPPHHNDFVITATGTGVAYEPSNRHTPPHIGYGYLEFRGAGAQTAQFELHARDGFDDGEEYHESFFITIFDETKNLSDPPDPADAGLDRAPWDHNLGGGINVAADGAQAWFGIKDDEGGDTDAVEVPHSWPLLPPGLNPGDTFRLLYVTNAETAATSTAIATYDAFVRAEITGAGLKAGGVEALKPYANSFRAIASTGTEDGQGRILRSAQALVAGEHAMFGPWNNDHPDDPIYWVGGGKVADNKLDFVDNDRWDSESPRHADGTAATVDTDGYWTGTHSKGGLSGSNGFYADRRTADRSYCNAGAVPQVGGDELLVMGSTLVHVGYLGGTGRQQPLGPLINDSNVGHSAAAAACTGKPNAEMRPMYALSGVFVVGSEGVTVDGGTTGTGNEAVTVANPSAAEGSNITFTVTLPSAAPTGGISVPYSFTDGRGIPSDPAYATATGAAGGTGADYANDTGSVAIAQGDTTGTFTVATTDDSTYEGDHYFSVTLGTPTAQGGETAPGLHPTRKTAVGIITDDADRPVFGFSPAAAAAGEGDGTIDVTVTKTGTTLVPASVYWTTADGTGASAAAHPGDYIADAGYLQFAPGDTSKTVTIDLVDDSAGESAETFKAQLSQPSDARLGSASEATITLNDDDGGAVSVELSAATYEVAEGESAAVGVVLSAARSSATTVQIASTRGTAASGTDFTAGPYSVTVPAGSTTASVMIATVDDSVLEQDETFTVSIAEDSLPTGVTAGSVKRARVTIVDDEYTFSFVNFSHVVNERAGEILMPAQLSRALKTDVDVHFTFQDGTAQAGTDFTAVHGADDKITIPAGERRVLLRVPITADTGSSSNKQFSVTPVPEHLPTGQTASQSRTSVAIRDNASSDERVDLSLSNTTVAEGSAVTLTATLPAAASGGDVTVPVTTATGSEAAAADYVLGGATAGTIVIADGQTQGSIRLTAVADRTAENRSHPGEELLLLQAGAAGLSSGYLPGRIAAADIADSSAVPVNLSVSASGAVTEGGGPLTVTATLATANDTGSAVAIPIEVRPAGTTAQAADYTVASTISIANGATTGTASFAVTDDSTAEDAETVVVQLGAALPAGYGAGARNLVTVTITDDDTAAVPVVQFSDASSKIFEGKPFEFPYYATIVVEAESAVEADTVVSFTLGGTAVHGSDYTIVDATSLTSETIPAGETEGQIVLRTLSDDNHEADETIELTLVAGDGYDLGSQTTHTVTIRDLPDVEFAAATSQGVEGETATVTVRASHAFAEATDVTFTVGGTATAADYTAPTSPVRFAAGETTATLSIPVTADTDSDDGETIILTLVDGDGYDAGPNTRQTTQVTHTITITGPPTVRFTTSGSSVVEGDDAAATVTVEASRPVPADTAVAFTVGAPATNGATADTDYTAPTSPVTIKSGETTATISIPILDDADDCTMTEDDGYTCGDDLEKVLLTLTDGADYDLADVNTKHTVTIFELPQTDDEGMLAAGGLATIELTEPHLHLTEGGPSVRYGISLTRNPKANVDVFVTSPDIGVFTVAGQDEVRYQQIALRFTRRNWDTPQYVTVQATPDDDKHSEQNLLIDHAIRGTQADSAHFEFGSPYFSHNGPDGTADIGVALPDLPVYITDDDAQPNEGLTLRYSDEDPGRPIVIEEGKATTLRLEWSRSLTNAEAASARLMIIGGTYGKDFVVTSATGNVTVTTPEDDTSTDDVDESLVYNPEIVVTWEKAATKDHALVKIRSRNDGKRATGERYLSVKLLSAYSPDGSAGTDGNDTTPGGVRLRDGPQEERIHVLSKDRLVVKESEPDAANRLEFEGLETVGDPAELTTDNAWATIGEDGAATHRVSVSLSRPPTNTSDVVLTVSTSDSDKLSVVGSSDDDDVADTVTWTSSGTTRYRDPVTVEFTAKEDDDADNEVVYVYFTMTSGFGQPFVNTLMRAFRVNIEDNDAGVTITPTSITLTEDQSRGARVPGSNPARRTNEIVVCLNADPGGRAIVVLTPSVVDEKNTGVLSTKLDRTARRLQFTGGDSGNWNTCQKIGFSAKADADSDDDAFFLRWTVTGYAGVSASDVPTVSIAVRDDDPAVRISESEIDMVEGVPSGSGGARTYEVVLNTPPAAGEVVIVTPASSDSDAVSFDASSAAATGRALYFGTSNWDAPRPVTIYPRDDQDEDDETATISHSVTQSHRDSGETNYSEVTTAPSVTVNVLDDDGPEGLVLSTDSVIAGEGGPPVHFTVRLAHKPSTDIVLDVAGAGSGVTVDTDSSTDGEQTTLTFTQENWHRPKTVWLTAEDEADATDKDDDFVTLMVGHASLSQYASQPVTVIVHDDEFTGPTYTVTGSGTITEGVSPAIFTVQGDMVPSSSTDVTLRISETGDFVAAGDEGDQTVTFGTSSAILTYQVPIVDDDTADDDGTITATLKPGSGYRVGDPSRASIGVADDGDTGSGSVTADLGVSGGGAVAEGGTLTVTVTLSGAAPSAVSVPVRVASSPAATAAAADYTLPSPVTVAMGDTSGTLTFTAVDDMVDEDAESLTLELGTLPAGVVAGSTTSVAVTISDDDTAGVTVVESGGSTVVAENGGTDTYTVKLDSEPLSNVVVRAVAPAGVQIDGPAAGRAWVSQLDLTFTSSNWSTVQTVTVRGQDDSVVNAGGKRDVTVGQSVHTGDTGGKYTTSTAVANVDVDVTDDDSAGVTVAGGPLTVSEDGTTTTGTYTVRLTSEPLNNVVVTATAAAGAQVSTDGGTTWHSSRELTFNPSGSGVWSTAQTVHVRGVNDHVDNAGDRRAVSVTHAITDGDGGGYTTGTAINAVSVTVTDDDTAGVTVSKTSMTVSEDGTTTTDTYTVKLNSQPLSNVVVRAAAPAGVEVDGPAGGRSWVSQLDLTFTSSNWGTAQTVTVRGQNDDVDNAGDKRDVTIAQSVHTGDTGGKYTTSTSVANVDVDVTDNDTAAVTVAGGPLTVTEDGSDTDEYTVVLATQPVSNVTITATAPDGAQVSDDGGSSWGSSVGLVFTSGTSGNWGTAQTVTVRGAQDVIDNPNDRRDVMITHSIESGDGDGSRYTPSTPSIAGVAVTVNDDDAKPTRISLSTNTSTVSEGTASTLVTVTATVDGSTRFGAATTVEVSVAAANADTSSANYVDMTAVTAFNITIAAGARTGTGTFTIAPGNDMVDETDNSVTVTGTVGDSTVTVNAATQIALTDDDAAPTGITLSAGSLSVTENGGAQTISVTATVDGSKRFGTAQTVAVSVAGHDAAGRVGFAQVSNFNIEIAAEAASAAGSFTLTPDDNVWHESDGAAQISGTSTVSVSGASVSLTNDDAEPSGVTLTVSPSSLGEGGGARTITVTATVNGATRYGTARTVNVTTAGSGNADAVDYTATAPNAITIPAGDPSAATTFTLTPTNDATDEFDETITVSGSGAGIAAVAAASVLLTDDDDTTVSMSASAVAVAENGGVADVTLSLSRALVSGETVTVPLDVVGVSAGSDYTLGLHPATQAGVALSVSGSDSAQAPRVTLSAGASSAVLRFAAVDDSTRTQPYALVRYGTGARAPSGSGVDLAAPSDGPVGWVVTDDETGDVVVPQSWALAPSGVLGQGEPRFRLVFVTSAERDASSGDIAEYDAFVRGLLAEGHADVVPYAGFFTVLGSTSGVHLRDHASVSGSATMPFYWLGETGDATKRVATDNGQFRGEWIATETPSSQSVPRDESGTVVSVDGDGYFTGSTAAGARSSSPLGSANVTVGYLNDSGAGRAPLGSGQTAAGTAVRRFYGLSPTFVRASDPVVSVTATQTSVAEGTVLSFAVSADSAPSGALTVRLFVSEEDGRDMVPDAQEGLKTVSFAAGDTSKTYTVTTTGDSTDEADSVVTVQVLANTGYTVSPTADTATVAVADNDAMTVSVSGGGGTVSEGSSLDYTVDPGRGLAAGETVTVNFAPAGTATQGDDYTITCHGAGVSCAGLAGATPVLTITGGSGVRNAVIRVGARNDSVHPETGETAGISLRSGHSSTGSGGTFSVTGTPSTFAIASTAPAALTASFAAAAYTATEAVGSRTVTVPVSLSAAAPSGGLSVSYTVGGTAVAADRGPLSGAVSFAQGATAGSITVTVVDDVLAEGPETIVLTITDGAGYDLGATAATTITITDNDAAPTSIALSVDDSSVGEGDGATAITVTATVQGATRFAQAQTVAVAVTGSGGAGVVGFTASPSTFGIPIAAGARTGTGTFTLTPADDSAVEADETVTVAGTLSGTTVSSATITVADDDTAATPVTVTLSAPAGDVTEGAAGAAGRKDVTVTLGRALTGSETVTVPLAVQGATAGSDYSFGLQPASQAGVSLLTGGSHSAQDPAVRFSAGASSAVLRFVPVNNSVRTQPFVTVAVGSSPAPAAGGGATLGAVTGGPFGFVVVDDETGDIVVPSSWALAPSGLAAGDDFRLLFRTSTTRDATSSDIADYDLFVRNVLASGGHADIVAYAGFFKAFASTRSSGGSTGTTARVHVGMASGHAGHFSGASDVWADGSTVPDAASTAGTPVWWLGGAKLANNYADLCDQAVASGGGATGGWGVDDPRSETGSRHIAVGVTAGQAHQAWTGTGNACEAYSYPLGSSTVSRAASHDVTWAFMHEAHSASSQQRPLYAMSPVFRIAGAAAVPVADFASASSTAAESAGTRSITVNLSPAPSSSVTVAYTLSGTAVRGSDYTISGVTSSSGTVTVGPSGTATIPVAIADDSSAESAETVVLTLGGGSGYTVGTAAPVHTLTISDNDTAGLPVVSWYSAASRAHEHDIARYPSFTISPAPQAPLTVRFAVDANASTAALGADYRITWQHPYTLHDNDRDGIWEGAITAPVTAPAYGYWRLPTLRFVDDRVRERDETIVMRLLDGAGYTLGAIAAYTVTIADNESGPLPPPPPPPAPQVTVTAGPAVDEGGHAVFTIAASPPAAGTVSVRYTVTQNGQFVASGQLGSGKTRSLSGAAATISVPTLNDSTDEADGSVTVTLTAGSGYVVGSPSSATVTVRDDDVPTAQFASAASTAAESAGTRNVTVRLVPAPAQSTTVSYALSGTAVRGSDYTISGVTSNTGSVTVGTSGTATIPVAVTDDSAPESAETVILTLTGGAGYDLGARRAHTLTITDNDTAGVPRVSVAAGPAVDEGAAATFAVSASPAPAGTVSVRYTVTQNGQFVTSGRLGSGKTRSLSGAAATISVPTHNDGADEADGSVTVTLTGGSGYVVGSPAAATVTVRDDDVPTAQFATAAASVDESSGVRRVRVSLSPAPHRGITVAYTVGGSATRGADFTAAGSVSAAAGAAFVDIPVTVIDDSSQEPDETVILTLTGGAGYQVGPRSTHTLTITDQDVSPTAAFAAAADQASESAGTYQVTLTVQPAPAAPITVAYTVGGSATRGGDYTAPGGTVTVAAGAAAAAVYIPVTDDSANEGDETVVLTLTAPGGGAGYVLGSPAVFTLTIADDDATPATPRVSFVHESSSVTEHDVARYPSFAISPAPPAPITIHFAVDADASTATLGADYQITSNRPYTLHDDDRDGIWEGTITAPTTAPAYGYWRLPTIRFVNDRVREPAETIVLRLLNGPGYTLGDNPAYTITITD